MSATTTISKDSAAVNEQRQCGGEKPSSHLSCMYRGMRQREAIKPSLLRELLTIGLGSL